MISVIVCTYNREDYILQCMESVAKQSADRDAFELVIVNNKSTDSTGDIIQKFVDGHSDKINVGYYIEENQGLSYARNRGIKESKGDFLVFIDDDAFINEDYIEQLSGYLKQHEHLNGLGFGGRIYPYLECDLPNWMSKYLMPLMSVMDRGDNIKEYSHRQFPIGANMGVSAAIVEEVGDFNVNLGRTGKNMLGGEEKDFFFRMRAKGYKVLYFPNVIIQHVIPASRLTVDFVKKQAIGIGVSERVRIKNAGFGARIGRYFEEWFKWGASWILFIIYLFSGKPAKAGMVIKFRWWVSKGLFTKATV